MIVRFGTFWPAYLFVGILAVVLQPARARGDDGQRTVLPQVQKTVDVVIGHSVDARTKITVAFFNGDEAYTPSQADIDNATHFKISNDPDLRGQVRLQVARTTVVAGKEDTGQFPNRVFSAPGLVVTCRLDIEALPPARVGLHTITVTIPSLVALADTYQSPGWQPDMASFTFDINVWESPAALAADPSAKARQALLTEDPQDAIDRIQAKEQARLQAQYDAAEKSGESRRFWVYVLLGTIAVLALAGIFYALARTNERKRRASAMAASQPRAPENAADRLAQIVDEPSEESGDEE